MIDHHPDPGPDPLAGQDPHPREQIDHWPLHDARQELLEEIVSQPGPGQSPSRSKALLSVVGVAAALALVVGGAWAVTRDGTGGGGRTDDEVVAAASDESSTVPSERATQRTGDRTRRPRKHETVRIDGVRVGKVRLLGHCPRSRDEQITVARLLRLQKSDKVVRYVDARGDRCRIVFRRDRDAERRP